MTRAGFGGGEKLAQSQVFEPSKPLDKAPMKKAEPKQEDTGFGFRSNTSRTA
jgi:hypothetical protein